MRTWWRSWGRTSCRRSDPEGTSARPLLFRPGCRHGTPPVSSDGCFSTTTTTSRGASLWHILGRTLPAMFLYIFVFISGFLSELEKGSFVCTFCQTVFMREKFCSVCCVFWKRFHTLPTCHLLGSASLWVMTAVFSPLARFLVCRQINIDVHVLLWYYRSFHNTWQMLSRHCWINHTCINALSGFPP